MFGIDWNGDGKEDFTDDMITFAMLDDMDKEDGFQSEKPTGSCLLFLCTLGALASIPIIGVISLI